jgi:hypothetical protein
MTAITDAANSAVRDFVTAGVPASGDHEPVKSEIRAVFGVIDAALSSLGVNGAITVKKATRALLYADLAHIADTLAIVYNDAATAQNGVYAKSGGSGSGSWAITSLTLPATFAADLAEALSKLEDIDAAVAATAADVVSAEADRVAAAASALTASSAASSATTAAAGALVALAASGGIDRYADTYAAAVTANSGWTNGDQILIFADETHQGRVALYTRTAGSLVFKAELTKAPNASVRVRAVSVLPADLTSPATLGGVTPANGDLFLLAGEAAPAGNGLYLMSGGNLARSADYDTAAEIPPGLIVSVAEGDYAGRVFILNTPGPITLGTTALPFVLLPGRPSSAAPAITSFTAIGDSITESSDFPTTNWVTQLGAALGVTPTNLAQGGDQLGDQTGFAMTRLPAAGHLYTFGVGTNDVQFSGSTNVQRRWLFAQGQLAAIMHLALPVAYPERVTAADMTTSAGTWTALGSGYEPTARFTSNNGAVKRATVYGTSVAVMIWINDSLDGAITVTIDGETFGPFPVQPSALSGGATTATDDGETYLPVVMIFDGLALKDHVVSVANTAVEGKFIVVSKVIGFDGSPIDGPVVLVGNLYDRGPTGWATGAAGAEGRTALFNQAIADNVEICNRLGLHRVRLWDWSTVINSLTLLKADELHPDQDGHDALYASALTELRRVLFPAAEIDPARAARTAMSQFIGFPVKNESVLVRRNERWVPVPVDELDMNAPTASTLTLNTGWATFGSPYPTCGYRKSIDGQVTLEGIADPSGSGVALIGTLPEGFRPASQHLFPVANEGALGQVTIATNGQITLATGDNSKWVALSGLAFWAA